jgi:hypothetical protein
MYPYNSISTVTTKGKVKCDLDINKKYTQDSRLFGRGHFLISGPWSDSERRERPRKGPQRESKT